MATTTTNFGWDIPQSTDLVKDGATAIATLGQDIDTALVDLKGGTTGQLLQKASATDLDFTWVTASFGKVLQVVSMTTSSLTTIATSTYTDSGMTLNITPSATSSKVLIIADCNTQASRAGTGLNAYARIVRGSTAIYGETHVHELTAPGTTGTISLGNHNTLVYLDSPSTTSSTTYKVQGSAGTGSTMKFQYTSSPSSLTLIEIGA
jgi:hypothetical protein